MFYNIYGNVTELRHSISERLDDYERHIYNKRLLRKKLRNIEYVYMHFVIVNFSKLLSLTNSDKFGLKQLKKFANKTDRAQIDSLENNYQGIFDKLRNNRNRIVAHVDFSDHKSYLKMGFSKKEKERLTEEIKKINVSVWKDSPKSIKKITDSIEISDEKSEERYSPIDFVHDFPEFRNILRDIQDLSLSILRTYVK